MSPAPSARLAELEDQEQARLAEATTPATGPESEDGIDHGTVRGYRQHRARKVPYCEPCRSAVREENRRYREGRASAAQQTWNRGQVGTPAAGREVPTGRDCPTDGCGDLATAPQPAAHMVHVVWPFSREPGRWYCLGPCQAYGLALAEIRAIPQEAGRA